MADGENPKITIKDLTPPENWYCGLLNRTWEHLGRVEPELPVSHNTSITLSCEGGYINEGGDSATCQNGVVVTEEGGPLCELLGTIGQPGCSLK